MITARSDYGEGGTALRRCVNDLPERARVVPGFPRLAVSREGGLWSRASGAWMPVDPDTSGRRKFMAELTRRAWPPEVRASPFVDRWTDGMRELPSS